MLHEKEVKKQSFISKTRRRASYFLSFVSLATVVVSFVTPYWLQSWPRVHTPFDRLGLWEFCMDGFIFRSDRTCQSYFGCWWIFAPFYKNILHYLIPVWFRFVQGFVTVTVILQLVGNIVFALYACKIFKNVERRAAVLKWVTIVHIVSVVFLTIATILFGVRSRDRYWMPNPTLNWPSWSFGCALLSAFSSLFATPLLIEMLREDRKHLQQAQYDFPMSGTSKMGGARGRSEGDDAASTMI